MPIAKFTSLLHERGLTQADLARVAGSHRSHVNQTLNNVPGRGPFTRKKLAPYLTTAERAALGWDEHGHLVPHGMLQKRPA